MNNEMHNHADHTPDDMQQEYDFSGGVRGKHYLAYQQGYTIRIEKMDGTVEEETYTPPPRTVVLDPDVFAYFADSEAVNRALRALIEVVPHKRSA
jgi:hypothetical protein